MRKCKLKEEFYFEKFEEGMEDDYLIMNEDGEYVTEIPKNIFNNFFTLPTGYKKVPFVRKFNGRIALLDYPEKDYYLIKSMSNRIIEIISEERFIDEYEEI